MARLQLTPIGTELANTQPAFWAELNEKDLHLDAKRQEIKAGWGEKYQKRVQQKGKRTTHERIAALADDASCIFPVGTFVNYGEIFGGEKGRPSPAAGVITSFVKIKGLWTVVIANDNTVASGSWWPQTPEKIIRAQKIALKLRVPVVYLVDCSGLFLPEQSKTFPGATGAGHIFKMNSELSAAGVPQIAGVFGDCIAGGGYMPIISDKVFMTEQAYMVIAGAALIQGAKSQNLSSLDIGGADVHVHAAAGIGAAAGPAGGPHHLLQGLNVGVLQDRANDLALQVARPVQAAIRHRRPLAPVSRRHLPGVVAAGRANVRHRAAHHTLDRPGGGSAGQPHKLALNANRQALHHGVDLGAVVAGHLVRPFRFPFPLSSSGEPTMPDAPAGVNTFRSILFR